MTTSQNDDVLDIVRCGDPILRRRAEPVDLADLRAGKLERLIHQMRATMDAAPGVGLAAPQIGLSIQLAVLEDGPQRWGHLSAQERLARERGGLDFTVLVNPTWRSLDEGDQISFYEGCLSIPGLTGVVARHRGVQVDAYDEHGEPCSKVFSGWAARIVQHEIDHLEGRLYIDRVETRSLSTTENYSQKWSGSSTADAAIALGFPLFGDADPN